MTKVLEFPKKGIFNRVVELETELQWMREELKAKDEIINYYQEKYEELKREKEDNSREETRKPS